jgi:hypothetical protein
MKKYVVELTAQEREELQRLIDTGRAAARKLTHARVLLKADAGAHGPAWTDEAISRALDVHTRTVEKIRQAFVLEGLDAALNRRPPRRQYIRKLDGRAEAHLIALACSEPPVGHAGWTLRLLADKMVELQVVDSLSHVTVHRILKKRTQAALEQAVVHPAQGKRRVRLCHGGRAGRLLPALRSRLPGGMHG